MASRATALTQMHNAGVPMNRIQSIYVDHTLADLANYLDVTNEKKQGAVAALNLSTLSF